MIRLLAPTDAPAYVMLRQEMLRDSPWAFSASPESDSGSNAAQVAESLARRGFAIAGAFEGGRLVAVAGLDREKRPKRQHLAWVWGVYTQPAARRQGLGRALLSCLSDLARDWGVAALLLSVSEKSPAARGLYEAAGFRVWGVEPDAIRLGSESFAETHMRKVLSGVRDTAEPG